MARRNIGRSARLRAGAARMVLALGLGALPLAARASTDQAATASADRLETGAYLAARHAQQMRDFPAAASWYEKAIAVDPHSPELISRTFIMEISVGHFERAKPLAEQELKQNPNDALAKLALMIDRLNAGDTAVALKQASALPSHGVHRFIAPMALGWTRIAAGDLAGAENAFQGLDKFNGLQSLKDYQLGLLYDFAGQAEKAEDSFAKAAASSPHLNWRLTDVIANFHQRHGQAERAQALYRRFLEQNTGREIARAVLAARRPGPPEKIIRSPVDGMAEAMFDLASVLNQAETVDLALVYTRFALALRPDFMLAKLLLSDVLSAERKPEQSLAVLSEIPADAPYSWSARLRVAANLDTLDRTEEAIAQLKAMMAEMPESIGAPMQLGDLLRARKRFEAAAGAYDEAIRRARDAKLADRWELFYDRGVALERSGHWERAEADLLHALEVKPDQPLVLNYLGYSWIDRGINLQRGLKMIEKAVELRPEDGYIVDSLGWAHYRLGDYAAAVAQLERATELVPEDPTINDPPGDAYRQTRRIVEARYQWRRALQFGPQENEVKPIEAKLERGLNPAPPTPRGG